jgi:aspartyl-tRNA(Asn)/glutamyl-tRNA(Gln) amidotransferase subunit C
MPISEQQVRHIASLARLDLSDSEIASRAHDLEAIVGYVDQLAKVDTTGVEPIANVTGLVNVTRADVPTAMLPTAAALGNAAQKNDNAFLVPKVVER